MKILDVSKLEKAYLEISELEKQDEIGKLIFELYEDNCNFIGELAKVVEENSLFHTGKQHIYYSQSTGKFDEIPITKFNEFIPRNQENITAQNANILASVLTKNRAEPTCNPATDKPQDRNIAKLTEALMNVKYEEDNEEIYLNWAALCAVLSGTVYAKDYWDSDSACDIMTHISDNPAEQAYMELSKGDTKVDMLSPLQVLPDCSLAFKHIDDGNYIGEFAVVSKSWVEDNFFKKEAGYYGSPDDLKETKTFQPRLEYMEGLKGLGASTEGRKEKPENGGIVKCEFYIKPTKRNPHGLTVITANNKLIYCNFTKYTYFSKKFWHPYSEFRYWLNPFSCYGITPITEVVSLNRRLNAIINLQALNRKTMAIPQWVIPEGSLKPGSQITGQPGQMVTAVPVGGMMPHKEQGMALDSSVYKEADEVRMAASQLCQINEILRGGNPTGVNNATSLQILLEQTNNGLNSVFKRLAKFLESRYNKKANNLKIFWVEARPQLVNKIKAMNKGSLRTEIDDTFVGKDLIDNIDIRIEAEGLMPKSKVVEENKLREALNMGLYGQIDPQINPIGSAELIAKLGMPKVSNAVDGDVARAEWENDLIRQKKFDQVLLRPIDNHIIHINILKKEMDTAEFELNNDDEVKNMYFNHLLDHFVELDPPSYQLLGYTQSAIMWLQIEAQARGIKSEYQMQMELQQYEQDMMMQHQMQNGEMPQQEGMEEQGLLPEQDSDENIVSPISPTDSSGGSYGEQSTMGQSLNSPGGY